MMNRVVLSMLVVLCASNAEAMHRQRRLVASMALQAPPVKDEPTNIIAAPPLPSLQVSATFVESHTARVENDLMLFQPTLIGIPPFMRSRNSELLSGPTKEHTLRFFAPVQAEDGLAVLRERDKLLLFRGPQPQGAAVGIGVAMFGAATLLSAHAPRPFRVLFDGPVHLGPAIFDGGGMGAGIAARAF
jgi:hypothetical protein